MTFYEVLEQVIALLQRHGRVTYRALKRQFDLDDDYVDDLKAELIDARQLAVDEQGKVLVWTGGATATLEPASKPIHPVEQPTPQDDQKAQAPRPPVDPRAPEAKRRQLTVLFCDLVDSTVLAGQLDPEEWREVVRAYQEACAKVIARYEGHIAQYLGDGLLVYFGWPQAHEDDAPRAVRAGLEMVEAMGPLNARMSQEHGVQLDVRLGIHTGLVVVGEVGGGTRREQLALGDTPDVAARLQGIAEPNTVVVSAAPLPLLGGFFACQSLGTHLLKGVAQPLEVYQVRSERTARSRLDVAGSTGLTPLVGREQEVGLLLERWAQVKAGLGQVVLLSGEAGIGKSRLVQVLTEQVATEPQAWLTPCQCSPYYQNTSLYPMIDLLERVVLRFEREESSPQKLNKLEGFLVQYGLPMAETVPLFVEELTKMVLESGLLQEREEGYELTGPLPPLAIPATLHDSLMTRLDRLAAVKGLAQLGATLGREFSYALLQAVAPWGEETLQRGLQQLVAAEFLYQRGLPPRATYLFKHALIQETAYQSLLRSTRQQHHQRIAQVMEALFPETAETQPELLTHHYTEAGINAQAIPYWQRAGQRAVERSAYTEAISHLTAALDLLTALPETRERSQQELTVQMTLGTAFRAIKGTGAPEVERLNIRARELCEQVGEPSQLFRVLWGFWLMYNDRVDYQMMRALGEQLLSLAQRLEDPDLLLEAHHALWTSLFSSGELAAARMHQEQGLWLYDPQRHRAHAALYSGHDPGVCCRYRAAPVLWLLGYPDQAVASSQAALALAQQLAHPVSLALALYWAAILHHLRREASLTQARAEAAMPLATDWEFLQRLAQAAPLRGWGLAVRGHGEEGITQIRPAVYGALRATRDRPYYLALLAEASAQVGQTTEGLEAVTEALATVAKSAVRW